MEVSGIDLPQPCHGGAELLLNLSPSSSTTISYHSHLGAYEDLVLLELDENLLQDFIHQRVVLRGQPEEDAVLCTQSKTYAIKFVGNSNSVFLIPPSNYLEESTDCETKHYKVPVIKVCPGNMELVEISPRLSKLKLLLSENPFGFDDVEEYDAKDGLYSWDDLIDRVQASDDELRLGLDVFSAFELGGYWRIVDEDYMDSIMTMFLRNSVLGDWSFGSLKRDEVAGELQSDGVPRALALHFMRMYCEKFGEDNEEYRLDAKRVGVHYARRILKQGRMKTKKFMEEWLNVIPESMEVKFDMLEGEVLTEKLGIESWLYAFRVSNLPLNPTERFSALFQERKKWAWKDLHPYIRDLKVPGLSLDGLLLKYTRRTQPTLDAEPIFSVRS